MLAPAGVAIDTRCVAREQDPKKKRRKRAPDPGLVGTTLAGRYHLVRMLGDGGMGAVYKAADQVLRRFVAIKLLHPTTVENPAAVERFVREARSAAAIGHPNIIDILDFGYEGERPYLVMEYLRGRSLSEAIAEEGSLPISRACNIATHSLAGLAAAHDRGILHRDLKPANMMLIALMGDPDFVKLCDFGFAALVVPTVRIDEGKTLTPERTLVGTPAYAAPERLRGDDRRDARIDVYSLGVVLFEMLAGRRPFDAPTFRELARKVRKSPPPSLRAIRTDIPKGLEHVVNKALAKDREGRWKNCEEFAAALVPFGGRVLPAEDHPSDSFTMDLLRIRARETQQHRVMSSSEADEILELRRRYREEREAKKKAREAAERGPEAAVPPRPVPRPAPRPEQPKPHPRIGAVPAPVTGARRALEQPKGPQPKGPQRRPTAPTAVADRPEGLPPPRKKKPAPAPPPDPAERTMVSSPPMVMDTEVPSAPPIFADEQTVPVQPEHLAASLRQMTPTAGAQIAPPPALDRKLVDPRMFSGAVALSVLRFVSRRFGERALTDLLATLPDGAASTFKQGVSGEQWVPYEAVNDLVQHVDARLGRDDLHLVVQCGRAAAEGAFDIMRSVRPPSPPPELLLADMPKVLGKILRGVSVTVGRIGRGYGRLEVDEHGESSLTFCVFLIGFIDRALDRFGATDVEVNLISSPALGDQTGVYEISWIS